MVRDLLVLIAAIIATRLLRRIAAKISSRLAGSADEAVQSESVKHGQAVASVISSVAIAVLYLVVSIDVLPRRPCGGVGRCTRIRGATNRPGSVERILHHH